MELRRKRHEITKTKAIEILKKEYGFKDDEIKTEMSVKVNGKLYIVDVAGIKKDFKVAIECGKLRMKKLSDLKRIFDVVLQIPVVRRGRCALCRRITDDIVIHHISYSPEVTVELCRSCHRWLHWYLQCYGIKKYDLSEIKKELARQLPIEFYKDKRWAKKFREAFGILSCL